MALRRATASEMTDQVIHDMMEALRENISRTSRSNRAQAFEFSVNIRNGLVWQIDEDTWDECKEPVTHVDPGEISGQLKRMESSLHRGLQIRLVQGFYGVVTVTVTLKNNTLAFAFFVRRQRKYEWNTLTG